MKYYSIQSNKFRYVNRLSLTTKKAKEKFSFTKKMSTDLKYDLAIAECASLRQQLKDAYNKMFGDL